MENLKVIAFFAVGALLIGAVLYFPLAFLARRFVSSRSRSYFAYKVTKVDAIYTAIFVAVLFGGFSMQHIAPDSWLGRFVSDWTGLLAWGVFVYLLAQLATIVSRAIALRRQKSALDALLAKDPVEPWSGGAADDHILPDAEAYSIEFFNDDTTPMEFVVNVIRSCFAIPQSEAMQRMLAIHNSGTAKVGRLSQSNAELLAEHIREQARKRNFPFRCEVTPWTGATR